MTALSPTRLQQAEFKRLVYRAAPEAGVTLKDIQQPTYWVHVARNLQPGCKIEAYAEDGSFYAELLVLNVANLSATVDVLFSREYGEAHTTEQEVDGYIIKFAGSHHLHQVIRKGKTGAENVVLKSGLRTKREAQDYIDGQLKAQAA